MYCLKPAFMLLLFWCFGPAWSALLPETYEIPGLAVESVRLGYPLLFKYDYNTTKNYSPYLVESINAILSFHKSDYRLARREAFGAEALTAEYLDSLTMHKIAIHKMNNLQGKVLRSIIKANIPVLLIGRNRNGDYKISRYHGDVIYLYQPPFITQSSKIDEKDRVFGFKTARGYDLTATEFKAPVFNEDSKFERQIKKIQWQVSQPPGLDLQGRICELEIALRELEQGNYLQKNIMRPFCIFDFFCVVTCPEMPLAEIKKRINQGLGDVGFEYKLPEFNELTRVDVNP
jgi:hypothetical protein